LTDEFGEGEVRRAAINIPVEPVNKDMLRNSDLVRIVEAFTRIIPNLKDTCSQGSLFPREERRLNSRNASRNLINCTEADPYGQFDCSIFTNDLFMGSGSLLPFTKSREIPRIQTLRHDNSNATAIESLP
jgi:hypothetical protein